MNKKLLEIKNLSSGYCKLLVLNNFSLDVLKNEIVVLLGWNGAGKSTCLKSIVGLTNIFSGDIILEDEIITNMKPSQIRKMGVSYAMQNHRCFYNLSIKENLEIASDLLLNKKIRNERKDYIFELFPELGEKTKQKASSLSGGMQQLLTIAMAIILPSTKLILLDEPSHGLEPNAQIKLKNILLNIKNSGISLLIVEQNKEFSRELGDRLFWIEEGRANTIN